MNSNVNQLIESIALLPPAEQKIIRRWLEEREAAGGEGNGSRSTTERSEKSLRWLDENSAKFLGQWVALDGDRLIASGFTAKEVYAIAKAEGVRVPFVELVTEREPVPFTGGWLS